MTYIVFYAVRMCIFVFHILLSLLKTYGSMQYVRVCVGNEFGCDWKEEVKWWAL